MADRFPLILNTSANQIQEIASGDSLDLTGSNVKGVGILTASNVTIGAATTDLVVNGDARITGILTVGTSSLKLDGPNNLVNVGTALTLGHTQGLQFHTQNLHSAGFEVNQINASGIITATGADINGDIDVDGHTNLDNVNIAGVTTFAQGISVSGSVSSGSLSIGAVAPTIYLNDTDANSDFTIQVNSGLFKIMDSTNSYATRLSINSSGNVSIAKDLDVDGHTNLDNVSIAGVTTFAGASTINNLLYVKGAENTDGILAIYADEGDDNADMWRLRAGTNSAFYIDNYANGAWQTNLAATATSTSLYSAGYVKVNTTTNGINVYNGESGGTTTINVTKGSGDAEVVCQRTGGSGIRLRGSHPSSFLETTNNTDLNIRRNTNTRISLGSNGNTIYGTTTFQNGITGTTASFSGNVSIGGVLTYEDVTNIDSVGIVTARAGINLTGGDITLGDSAGPHKLKFGASGDFQLFHNGSNNYIDVAGDGHLYIRPKANFYIQDYTNGEVWIDGTLNGGVKLYYNGTKVIETKGYGLDITGGFIQTGSSIVNDNGQFKLGTGGDYKLYHDGSSSFMDNVTGDLYMRNSSGQILIRANTDCYISNYAANEHRAAFKNNGAVELYFNGAKKLETTSNGILMSGDVGISTTNNSTETGGFGVQRFWHTGNITAGNVYKCGQWYTGEGTVQLLIAVRSHTAGNSGTTTYMYQGGFSAIGSTGIARLLPLAVGTGHGNGPDNGTNSNAWEVLIDNINNYTYAVYIHVPSGTNNKHFRVTVTEVGRGLTFTDLSSTVAYSSLTVQSSPIFSSNYNHFGHTYLRDNYTINLGNSNDLKLFHDGSHSYIHDNGTGNLRIRGDDVEITDSANNNNMARFIEQGGVELYYNNSKHFEVTSFGAETVYSSGGGSIPIFKTLHGNRSQGIGLGYNGISAIGTNTNVELFLKPKGTSALYIQRDNGANMLRANPGAELILYHNGEETAQTYNTNGRKAFLVGDKAYINNGLTHGELIVRKNLSSPNNASISQCARMTVITNEITAGGNGYGGAVYFMGQDVSTTNQYAEYAAIGAKMHASADLANSTPNCDFSVFTRHGSSFSEGFRVRYDGTIYANNTTVQSLSDIRLKENIEDYSFDLNKFKQFKPISFNWKKPECHPETESGKHRGFIAQDVQKLDSYLLTSEYDLDINSEERELVDEDAIALTSSLGDKDAMYVSVIQQLIDKIEKLESEVAALKGS